MASALNRKDKQVLVDFDVSVRGEYIITCGGLWLLLISIF